jgi:hypothetical protein
MFVHVAVVLFAIVEINKVDYEYMLKVIIPVTSIELVQMHVIGKVVK